MSKLLALVVSAVALLHGDAVGAVLIFPIVWLLLWLIEGVLPGS